MLLLSVVVILYALLCLLLYLQQDRMVFPGAGYGERSDLLPQGDVSRIGAEGQRTRLCTLSTAQPNAVLLYFGGNGEDLVMAAANAAELRGYGGEVIAVEYPGYGSSQGEPSVASLMATAEAAAVVARARAAELHVPFVVVGSSLGSFCATHVAAMGADKLVLRAPPTSLAAVAKTQFWWLPVDLLLRHRFDNLAVARHIACPTLVLHGTADDIVPLRFGSELTAALPQARMVLVPGAGHNDLSLALPGPSGKDLRAFLGGG